MNRRNPGPILPGFYPEGPKFTPEKPQVGRAVLHHFDGDTYQPALDQIRLNTLMGKVYRLMADHQWRTLAEIHAEVGTGTEASISARLRDLRKQRFGSHRVERRRRLGHDGLFEYRVMFPFSGEK